MWGRFAAIPKEPNFSPARVPAAITVGSSSRWGVDRTSPFSKQGKCVDLFAPGHNITSASNTGDYLNEVMSGASMVAPHVTGWVAMYLQLHKKATPAGIQAALIEISTKDMLWAMAEGTPNRLLYVPNLDDQVCKVETAVAQSEAAYTSERKSDFGQLYRLRDEVFSTSAFGRRLIKIHKNHSFEAARVLLTNGYLRAQLMDLLESSRPTVDSMVDGDGRVPLNGELIVKIETYLRGVAQKSNPALQAELMELWREADLRAHEGRPIGEAWKEIGRPQPQDRSRDLIRQQ